MAEVARSIRVGSTLGGLAFAVREVAFFIAGFAAGEGSFAVVSRSATFADGRPRQRFVFSITVAHRDRPLLEAAQQLIQRGFITDVPSRHVDWQPTSRYDIWAERDHLEATIPFFDIFLLPSKKRSEFERWRDALTAYRDSHPVRSRAICSVPNCDAVVRGRGLCRSHYYRATGY